MQKWIGWGAVFLVIIIMTTGTIAGGITGRQLVNGKAGDLMGGLTDLGASVIDALQDGMSKLGDDAPPPTTIPAKPGA